MSKEEKTVRPDLAVGEVVDTTPAMPPFELLMRGHVMLSVPWDAYVAAVWVMHSEEESLAAAMMRPKTEPTSALKLSTGLLVHGAENEALGAIRKTWRLIDVEHVDDELEHVHSAHKALEAY